jgi:hypothetical protein
MMGQDGVWHTSIELAGQRDASSSDRARLTEALELMLPDRFRAGIWEVFDEKLCN